MLKAQQITSTTNPLLKEVRKAVARGGLTDDGYCVAEGFHLLDEALRSSSDIRCVIASEESFARLPRLHSDIRLVTLPGTVFATIASTEASQGIASLVRLPEWNEADLQRGTPLVAILDGVQDPGNCGAIVRAAEAFGATGVVFGQGSARPANPKTLRASAGSLFRIPFLEMSHWLPGSMRIFATMPFASGVQSVTCADLKQPFAFVIGSEGKGISEIYQDFERIAIPTAGVESLNAAVAASILLYEAHRQRGVAAK